MRKLLGHISLASIILTLSSSLGICSCFDLTDPEATPAMTGNQDETVPEEGETDSGIDARPEKVVYQVELFDPVFPAEVTIVYDVILSKDQDGYPVEYALSFEAHVCTDGECEVVELTMIWNAIGDFQRLTHPPDKPLTKKEHVPFSDADYAKLDRILKDRASILESWTLDYLDQPEAIGDGVDAVTSPTPTTVRDSVVQDAAYTSWALWHWANGEIVSKLRDITKQDCTPEYLNHMLVGEDRRCVDFALDYVMEQYPSDPLFVESAFYILENGEREQMTRSLEFLSLAIPDKQAFHARLIESFYRMPSTDCPIILQELDAETDLPATTIEKLTGRLSQLPYYPVHLILKMLEERKCVSEQTISDVAALLDGDNFFIARRASEHLLEQDLDADTESKVNAFRERNSDRL